MTPKDIEKAILISHCTAKGTFEEQPIPKAGEVPFGDLGLSSREIRQKPDGRFVHEPDKPDVEKYSPTSKARVNRNRKESVLVRLYTPQPKSGKFVINTQQYNAGLHLLGIYDRIMPSTTGGYGDRVEGGGSVEDSANSRIDAQTQLLNIAELMDNQYFDIVSYLVLEDRTIEYIAQKMKGRGPMKLKWSTHYRTANVTDALDQLSRILPQAKRMKRNEERMVA